MNNFSDLDSLYNKKAKLYKNIKIEKKVEICDLTLEAELISSFLSLLHFQTVLLV